MPQNDGKGFAAKASEVAMVRRAIRDEAVRRAETAPEPSKDPPQTGARMCPVPPYRSSISTGPWTEGDLDLSPIYDAAYYKGSDRLEGMAAIVTMSGYVSDPAFCRHLVEETFEAFGRLDVLVNAAAFQQHVMRLEDLTEEHFDHTPKTNLDGYFNMAKAALPRLKQGGSIINTVSVTGLLGPKNLLDDAMTKGGIHAFTRSLS
jgi:NAD(P)-dependent dehydrogenase (short-subunit alcohol dehydrogenase family)